jgi:hypothetical protein
MRDKNGCPTCAEYHQQLLDVMREHLRAEHELAHAIFMSGDGPAATEANQRALSLLQRARQLRAKAERHRVSEHEQRDVASELMMPDNN